MKIALVLSVFVAGVFFTSCSSNCPAGDAGYAVIRSYGKESKKNQLGYCTSIGGGFDYDRIRMLATSFEIDNPEINVDEARVFFVKGVEGFLAAINNDPKARPYLAHYPFTYNDIRFGLSFPRRSPLFISNVNVGYATLANGKIYYCSYDKEMGNLTDLCNEEYPEALKIVYEAESSGTNDQ